MRATSITSTTVKSYSHPNKQQKMVYRLSRWVYRLSPRVYRLAGPFHVKMTNFNYEWKRPVRCPYTTWMRDRTSFGHASSPRRHEWYNIDTKPNTTTVPAYFLARQIALQSLPQFFFFFMFHPFGHLVSQLYASYQSINQSLSYYDHQAIVLVSLSHRCSCFFIVIRSSNLWDIVLVIYSRDGGEQRVLLGKRYVLMSYKAVLAETVQYSKRRRSQVGS